MASDAKKLHKTAVLAGGSMLKQFEEIVCKSDETIRLLLNGIPEAMLLINGAGDILAANITVAHRLGQPLDELIGCNLYGILPFQLAQKRKKIIDEVIRTKVPVRFQDTRAGMVLDNNIYPLLDAEGNVTSLAFFSQDITERKLVEDELHKAKLEAEQARERAETLAKTDYLTGLLNRWAFAERFDAEAERANREQTSFSMIMADIDHFKKVNDSFGHEVGDMVLRDFSASLLEHCRSYDFLGRHGGEEFVIGLPNTSTEQAVQIAERMRRAAEKLEISIPGISHPIKVTASFGVATTLMGVRESLRDLTTRADQAMYQAKTQGRNRVTAIQ